MAKPIKQDIINAIERMPDNVGMEEIMYQLYVLENIQRGQQNAAQGNSVPAEQVLRDISSNQR